MASVEAQVAHIWRRLGMGPTIDDIEAGVAAGPAAVIDDLCDRPLTTASDWGFPVPTTWEEMESFSDRLISVMSHSANPLQERVAWILNGLLVVSLNGSVAYEDMKVYEEMLRTHGLGSYRALLEYMTTSTGMLFYLSGINSNRWHPNENYARELMELFSLGVRHPVTGQANYHESDIREMARALTGYRWHWEQEYQWFDANWWDSGSKTFLGAARGQAGVTQTVQAVTEQSAWRAFVPARVYEELVGAKPAPSVLSDLGDVWGASGDMRGLVRAIANRPEFLADASMRNCVKSPVELVAAANRILGWTDMAPFHLTWQLGRVAGHPLWCPSVSGFNTGREWLHASYLMVWTQVARDMCFQDEGGSDVPVQDRCATIRRLRNDATPASAVDLCRRLAGIESLSSQTQSALTDYVNARPWDFHHAAGLMHLMLLSPEFLVS